MMTLPNVLRYAAFTDRPGGGNPAGIVLDAEGLDEHAMLAVAAEVGYSETAFLRAKGPATYEARYFSSEAEVPFCGHATIASAVAIAERGDAERLVFLTRVGEVTVDIERGENGFIASLTSVPPRIESVPADLVDRALSALRWRRDELESSLPPRIAYAGVRHLILAARTRERLAKLDYDFEALKRVMLAHELTTVDLVWRENAARFHARNPFPVGGVVEDPATGAAAAALGGYLRALDLLRLPARIEIRQGEDMGRPSRLMVDIGEQGGIRVSGTAVAI